MSASLSTRSLLLLLLLLGLTGLAGCVESYVPDIIATPPDMLVVDGFINAAGPTTVRLSRTASLAAATTPPSETRARLVVEDEVGGFVFSLTETTPGTYAVTGLALNPSHRYRLRITTARGHEYASDFVRAKITPPIDEVRWVAEQDALSILVSTHDDARASEYYRWDFDQTWEIRPPYRPFIEYANRAIRRIVVPYPSVCWQNDQTSRILLSKTTALSQDRVSNFRVQGLASNDRKLYSRYSILVRQQAFTQAEYNYWEQLRKNTEALGTLFDPQPSQTIGNVRSLSADAPAALGFVGVHSVTEKRLFISASELPREWLPRSGYESCLPPDTVYIIPRPPNFEPVVPADVLFGAFSTQMLLPIEPYFGLSKDPIGYLAKEPDCIDCRLRGTAVRPSFW